MKKIAVFLFISLYTLSVTGITINEFYCCGKIESVTFSATSTQIHAEKNSKSEGCCENKQQSLKVKDTHVFASIQLLHSQAFTFLPATFYHYGEIFTATQTEPSGYFSHAPPLNTASAIYLSNCTFRI